jgi:hypothetical protein
MRDLEAKGLPIPEKLDVKVLTCIKMRSKCLLVSVATGLPRAVSQLAQVRNLGLGVALSVGELRREDYQRLWDAGAHRYLLRIEVWHQFTGRRGMYYLESVLLICAGFTHAGFG